MFLVSESSIDRDLGRPTNRCSGFQAKLRSYTTTSHCMDNVSLDNPFFLELLVKDLI